MSFKASVAPFHQWTPDVYEGAPTPVTAFMAVATKAAALGVMLRFFDVALLDAQSDWGPAIAALATITIVVGNVGALGQSSLKRLMAWSSVAQAGYMLAGVVVATRLGVQATVFYLATYLFMNMAAFARDRRARALDPVRRRHPLGRGPRGRAAAAGGGDRRSRCSASPGIPATAGFIGKFYLIDAAVAGDYTWLGVVIVIGSMVSLGYYLRVIAAMWMQSRRAGRRGAGLGRDRPPGARRRRHGRRRAARAARGLVRRAAVRGGDAVLRDHPVAAVRPGRARRVGARRNLF